MPLQTLLDIVTLFPLDFYPEIQVVSVNSQSTAKISNWIIWETILKNDYINQYYQLPAQTKKNSFF